MKKIALTDDSQTHWFGMGNYEIKLTLINKTVRIMYVSEPPFGDSYHQLYIDNVEFEGFVWGCEFLFPFGQAYLICSWMKNLYQRKTLLIDLKTSNYYVFPIYYGDFKRRGNSIDFENKLLSQTKTLDLNDVRKLFG
ncbi:hypothetical protein [Hymenobacter sp. IS2118]|uniref:hypothetical protein n=1 Tax=Hymenobacter sp. IS2118 TaxID=1505605 RepID=UPI001268ED0A|nr:hypothetical protein [Hymenobacter sp. IS2118]